jgi:aldehyde:ferredoxin oxidoreductase
MKVDDPVYGVEDAHKPEYETLGSFGSMCLNDNVISIIKANDLCNRYGFDTISAGATIAFAMECYEHGLITDADTEGVQLTWGNDAAIIEMVHRMARREGIGDVLADGVWRASQRIGGGSEAFAVHCGGQEPAMMDSRFFTGLALGYKVDPTPGRHLQLGSWVTGLGDLHQERLGLEAGPDNQTDFTGKGPTYRRTASILQTVQASGICYFPWYYMDPVNVPEFLTAVTGEPFDLDRCMEIGERIEQLRYAFGLREGWNPLTVAWNERVRGIPTAERGPLEGVVVDVEQLTQDYFTAMGWDLQTAMPDPERLEQLGLHDVADDARKGFDLA